MIASKTCSRWLLPLMGALTLAAAESRAEPRLQPLPIEALTDYAAPLSPALSPDGTRVALPLNVPDRTGVYGGAGFANTVKATLHMIETRTGRSTRIGPLDREAWSGLWSPNPVWSPDSTQLVFQADTEDRARLWVWSVTTGKSRQLADVVPRRLDAPARWSPDGGFIVVAVVPEGMTDETIKERSGAIKNDSAYPLDEHTPGARVAVYRSRAGGPAVTSADAASNARQDYARNNVYLADLAVIDVATGRVQRLVRGFRPYDYRVSPDGRYVSFTHFVGQQAGSGYRNLFNLMVAPTDGGAPRVLAEGVLQEGHGMEATWSPDGRSLAFCDSGPATRNDCYVTHVDRTETRKVSVPPSQTPNWKWQAPVWDASGDFFYLLGATSAWQIRAADLTARPLPGPDGKQVLEIVTRRDSGVAASHSGQTLMVRTRDQITKAEGFYALDPSTSAAKKLREEAEHVGRFSVDVSADARTISYTAQRADAAEQLWASDLNFRSTRQLTDLNPQWRDYRMGKSRLVRWRSLQGEELQGALLLPADYQPGRRYPLVVYVYGGDKLSNDLNAFGFNDKPSIFYENMQLLATRGYVVLRPDTETRIGTPMRDIAESLLPAVDKLIEEGVADPERLGLMGRSYGGYSVLSLLVQTNRFKAAIEVCGPASLPGVFSEMTPGGTTWKISWAEESQGKMGGTLWEYRERYIENSPLFYFDRVTTPLLIVHGTEDTAVAVHHGDEIFQALRRLGKEVEYAKYLGEPHVIVSGANAIDYANRMIAWFDKHLKSHASAP